MARRLWPGQDAVGKRLKIGPPDADSPWFTVVGVVGDMRRQGPEYDPIPQMFESLPQNPSRLVTLLVRTSVDPVGMMGAVQAAARQVDKDAPVYGVTTLEDRLGQFNAQRRFQTSLLIAFARGRVAAGRHWYLRTDALFDSDAHARNQHPHRRGRAATRHSSDDSPRRAQPQPDRIGAGTCGSALAGPAPVRFCVRRSPRRIRSHWSRCRCCSRRSPRLPAICLLVAPRESIRSWG